MRPGYKAPGATLSVYQAKNRNNSISTQAGESDVLAPPLESGLLALRDESLHPLLQSLDRFDRGDRNSRTVLHVRLQGSSGTAWRLPEPSCRLVSGRRYRALQHGDRGHWAFLHELLVSRRYAYCMLCLTCPALAPAMTTVSCAGSGLFAKRSKE